VAGTLDAHLDCMMEKPPDPKPVLGRERGRVDADTTAPQPRPPVLADVTPEPQPPLDDVTVAPLTDPDETKGG